MKTWFTCSILQIYGKMSSGQLQTLRFSLLNFLQGVKIRVSVFLRENVQTMEGRFIIPLIRTIHPGNILILVVWTIDISMVWTFPQLKANFSQTATLFSLDCEVPGFIRYFDTNGEVNRMERFYPGGSFSLAATKGSLRLVGDRGTRLGCNMWDSSDMHTNK